MKREAERKVVGRARNRSATSPPADRDPHLRLGRRGVRLHHKTNGLYLRCELFEFNPGALIWSWCFFKEPDKQRLGNHPGGLIISVLSKGTMGRERPTFDRNEPADYETAATMAGFGFYNYLILLSSFMCSLSHQFSSASMSYLLPAAQCDLNMQASQKGLLNGINYGGMITSALIWGFLSDTFGRRKLLVIAYFIDGVLSVIGSFTQSFEFLISMKFIAGVIMCGPNSIQKTFISEFHNTKYRPVILMLSGFFYAIATIVIPGVAWLIIPLPWSWTFFNGYITYNSWRIFVAVAAIPSFLAALLIYQFTETPKFLMTKGRVDEALQSFQLIYKYNSRKPSKSYPIKHLRAESVCEPEEIEDGSNVNKNEEPMLSKAWNKTKQIFFQPLRSRIFMIIAIQFSTLFGSNTLRLWAPQLFASIAEYTEAHKDINGTQETGSVCEMLSYSSISNVTTITEEGICGVGMTKSTVYVNNMIIATIQGILFLAGSYIVNSLGKKRTMISCYIAAAVCTIAMYWTTDTWSALAAISFAISLCGVSHIASLSVVVDMFPTSVRNVAMSLNQMAGQFGSFTGNMVFPHLLAIDCLVPFASISGLILFASSITAFLPIDNKAALQ